MAGNQRILFPICIREYREVFKMYIPAIDMETKVKDYLEALNKARSLLQSYMMIDDVISDMIMKEPCPTEEILGFLKEKGMEEYYDAQIVFVDDVSDNWLLSEQGELTLSVSQHIINDLESERINYTGIFKDTMEEVLRRKHLFNNVKEWTGKTVEISTFSENEFYGMITDIKYKEDTPWNFTVKLQTGLCDWKRIDSSAIDLILECPVVINEYGTFHITNQGGMVSLFGEHWWKKGHIDVYLEYDPAVGLENQKAFEHLAKFCKVKYKFDNSVRKILAEELIKRDEILALFAEYDGGDLRNRNDTILEYLVNKMDPWFIDISASGSVYMDYNFSNGIGKFSVGVRKLTDDAFDYKLNSVTLYDEEAEEDENDEM